jgi:hypothetical protein
VVVGCHGLVLEEVNWTGTGSLDQAGLDSFVHKDIGQASTS